MDNKLTRKRVSDLLQYDWILLIVFALVAVIIWEVVFSLTAVKLKPGQHFKYYIDIGVHATDDDRILKLFDQNKSFDVLEIAGEEINVEQDVLSARLANDEGDVIFTQLIPPTENSANKEVRAKTLVDQKSYFAGSFDKLLKDAKAYLRSFLVSDTMPDGAELDYANLSTDKIDAGFLARMKGDNRFRTDAQKENGKLLERDRIKDLCREVKDFDKLLSIENTDLFFNYTRHEQNLALSTLADDIEFYTERLETEKQNNKTNYGREQLRYGLNLSALKGKVDASEFFTLTSSDNSKLVVLMFFDLIEVQPELQFESIIFVNALVRTCSTLLD